MIVGKAGKILSRVVFVVDFVTGGSFTSVGTECSAFTVDGVSEFLPSAPRELSASQYSFLILIC